jgi:hypothetical protein
MKHKLIMENWRRFVEEVEGEEQVEDGAEEGRSEKLLGMNLSSFVAQMKKADRQDIVALMQGLEDGDLDDDKISISPGNVKIAGLIPTQNEVVWGKSVPFALERPKMFEKYYTSDGPFNVGPPNNNAIVTLNGKYIMDGHHRWSSLFCVNPNASMATFNITAADIDPLEMLNLMQASILKYSGGIPSAKGGGTNLFEIGKEGIATGVFKILKKNSHLAGQYKEMNFLSSGGSAVEAAGVVSEGETLNAVAKQLIGIYTKNIAQMQANNKPVGGASARPSMPQTDNPDGSNVVAGGATPAALAPLTKGTIDHASPFKK